jgi:hypothetical protein
MAANSKRSNHVTPQVSFGYLTGGVAQ